MASPPPPKRTAIPEETHRGPIAAFFAIAVVLLIMFSGVTVFWYVTGTGPFTVIEPSVWAFTMTQVTDLQAQGFDGQGVTVCLVDSGIDTANAELSGVDLLAWRDFVNNRAQPYDDQGHGTAMAGIIFAHGRLTGVARSASLVVAKAITSAGSGTDSDIAAAIDFCTSQAVHVISLSLGGEAHPFLGSLTESAADRALDAGILVVAAAGNDGLADDGRVESPASVTRAIAVGAVDREGIIARFTSRGDNSMCSPPFPSCDPSQKPEIVAPGVEIATVLRGGTYAYVSGTSPAAAIVSGIVALLLEEHPEYRHDVTRLTAFKTALMDGAQPSQGQQVPHDDRYGYGIVRAAATEAFL